jgi:hypothetical protein
MRAAIDGLSVQMPDGVALRAHIVLRPGPDGVAIRTLPATLLGAMWLQLGQHLAGGAAFMTCDHCGGWFAAGRPGGRRRVARFCSSKCKNDWHNARRSIASAPTDTGLTR